MVDGFFFFFQAEDGIRDFHVTGVQTCALPIRDDRGRACQRFGPPAARLFRSPSSLLLNDSDPRRVYGPSGAIQGQSPPSSRWISLDGRTRGERATPRVITSEMPSRNSSSLIFFLSRMIFMTRCR